MSNEKLEKLRHDQYVAERKLSAAKHKEKRLENEIKRSTRSERPHLLSTAPGMFEAQPRWRQGIVLQIVRMLP